MGFAYQTYPIVGGTVLIIERVESQNFVTNVSGWAIFADGSAEFFNVTIRGSLFTGPAGSRHIEITDTPGNRIDFYTGGPAEVDPGFIDVNWDGGTLYTVQIYSPFTTSGGAAGVILKSDSAGTSTVGVDSTVFEVLSTTVQFNAFPKARTAPALSGLWTAVGQAPSCYPSVDGIVHLSGIATGGALLSQIFVLPLAMRPNAQKTFPVNANGAYGSLRVDVSGAVVFTAGSTTNVSLSGVNFPIF